MTELIPCPACQRHYRADEPTCPFCGSARAACASPCAPSPARRRPSRPALFAAGAAAVGVVACSTATPVYGAPTPPQDAAADMHDSAAASDAKEVATADASDAPLAEVGDH